MQSLTITYCEAVEPIANTHSNDPGVTYDI
jgi:hypothetical protein